MEGSSEQNMKFTVEKKLTEIGSGIYLGVVTAYGLDNGSGNSYIRSLLEGEIQKICQLPEDCSAREMKELVPYREAMRQAGIQASKYPCSVEAMIRRILKKKEIPFISPAVDLGNYISLKYRVPVGVHDIDTTSGELSVRLATEEDCRREENHLDNDRLQAGEPVYVSGNSVRTRRWLWRQMPAGRVNGKSRNFLFPIDGFQENREAVDAACRELAELLERCFGVSAGIHTVTGEHSRIYVGELTQEEKEIEDQMAIMLKGVAQHTAEDEIRERLAEARKKGEPLRIKLGLDPSAPDIHIGHSVVLRKIRQLQDLGHVAVIIIGDYTGMIGDPTGKSRTRKQLSRKQVEENANTYMEQIFKVIDRDRTEVYFNSQWLEKMTFGDVIQLASKCTVARMLERDDFNNRYTNHQPLSVHEFFYPLMQAYDSVAVRADLELGGTDQTFNILLGRNIQKDYGQKPQLTLFMPLLEGIDGVEKMSKSLGNYVGISEKPEIIYEKLMKIPDSLIIKYYNLCTDVHPDVIRGLEQELENGANPRDIKMKLAYEITALYAGDEAARKAGERFQAVFQKNQVPDDVPVIHMEKEASVLTGEEILNHLVSEGYYKSKNEVRRIFRQGGASWDGERILDARMLKLSDEDSHVLKLGKGRFFRIIGKDGEKKIRNE